MSVYSLPMYGFLSLRCSIVRGMLHISNSKTYNCVRMATTIVDKNKLAILERRSL